MEKPKVIYLCVLNRVEKTGDPDYPYKEVCESVEFNGKEIEVPENCQVIVSRSTYYADEEEKPPC